MRLTSAFLIVSIVFAVPAWPGVGEATPAHPDACALNGVAASGSLNGPDCSLDLYAPTGDRSGPSATRAEPVTLAAAWADPRPLASTPDRHGAAPSRPGEPERVWTRGP